MEKRHAKENLGREKKMELAKGGKKFCSWAWTEQEMWTSGVGVLKGTGLICWPKLLWGGNDS